MITISSSSRRSLKSVQCEEANSYILSMSTAPVISPLLMIIRIEELWNQVHKKRQVTGAKNKLANQMDNLSVSDEYYDKKYEDIQVRLDKLYDEIEEIETFIEAVETRLYNIKQEKISGDNVYQFLLFFDNLYDRFTDMEKKIFMKSFLEEGNIYEAEQEDGRILRSLKFRFPVFFNEQELYELDWDNESTVESVLLMRRAKR